jgi:hypothetical protein
MSAEARAQLAAQQAAVVSSLAGLRAAPDGFDVSRMRATALALATKRRRAVARAWPALTLMLGDRFAELFRGYGENAPLPLRGGPLADGRAFLRWLASAGENTDACSLQTLAIDLRFRSTSDGLVPRRGPALRVVLLHGPLRLVIGLRLPWLGEHGLTVPLELVQIGRRSLR